MTLMGLFSLWAAARAPSSELLAIEPSQQTFALLVRNLLGTQHALPASLFFLARGGLFCDERRESM